MMMYRINTGNRGLVKLEWIDYLFLCINSVVEWQFTCHVIDIVLSSPELRLAVARLGTAEYITSTLLDLCDRRRLLRAPALADAPALVLSVCPQAPP